ncbi:MAG: hypothetical protein K0M49_16975 [Arenimonas sp.]|nr:hypothetical protein [Arenimonas sp.]
MEDRSLTNAATLPPHGRIECNLCHHQQHPVFDRTVTEEDGWRISYNPLAWGGSNPDVIVLGFSKGPTQAGALTSAPHDQIAYKGGRSKLAKILHHLGLIERPDPKIVDQCIADRTGQFHFGSLIRCTVQRFDPAKSEWLGTGGGMLDKFIGRPFGAQIAKNCSTLFLQDLPERTRLIVMMGMGSRGNYIAECRRLFETVRAGPWRTVNEVAYADPQVVVVHVEHFASQGALLPNWLSGTAHERGRLGLLAREAVYHALTRERGVAEYA